VPSILGDSCAKNGAGFNLAAIACVARIYLVLILPRSCPKTDFCHKRTGVGHQHRDFGSCDYGTRAMDGGARVRGCRLASISLEGTFFAA